MYLRVIQELIGTDYKLTLKSLKKCKTTWGYDREFHGKQEIFMECNRRGESWASLERKSSKKCFSLPLWDCMVAWKFIPLHGSSILLSKDYLKEKKKKDFHSYLLCLHFVHGTVLPRHRFLAASVLCLKLKFLGRGTLVN